MPKWLFHPLVALILSILAIWLYFSLLQTEEKMRLSAESVSVLDQEVQGIAAEVSELEEKLAQANSTESLEQRIRDELLLQKSGEYVIQVPLAENSVDEDVTTTKTSPLEEWQKLLF